MTIVFNDSKTIEEYKNTPLFLGSRPGLFDTINKKNPKIWSLYKEMKSLDWSEDEFDYSQCNNDFKSCPKSVSDMMIRTLIWQWEADSVASNSIAPVLAPFISSSELWACWQRISDNEVVHSATYSEIVRMSFDDPNKVLEDVLANKESLSRLSTVGAVLSATKKRSYEYALGLAQADQDTYNHIYRMVCALYALERIQFMASFAITFTICSNGYFQPIGKAVQKIAQDELQVHVELDKEVLRIESKTEFGRRAAIECSGTVKQMVDEIVNSEMIWVDYLFSEGRELVGATAETVKQWVLYNAAPVYKFLNIETDLKFPKHNPMPHLEDWIDIGKSQGAPQEADQAMYKVGIVVRDDDDKNFNVDF